MFRARRKPLFHRRTGCFRISSWGNPGQHDIFERFWSVTKSFPGYPKLICFTRENSFLSNSSILDSGLRFCPQHLFFVDSIWEWFWGCPWSSSPTLPPHRPPIHEFLFSISGASEVQSLVAKLEKSLPINLFFQVRTAFNHTLVCRFWEKSMPFAGRVYQKCMERESKFSFPGTQNTFFWVTPAWHLSQIYYSSVSGNGPS